MLIETLTSHRKVVVFFLQCLPFFTNGRLVDLVLNISLVRPWIAHYPWFHDPLFVLHQCTNHCLWQWEMQHLAHMSHTSSHCQWHEPACLWLGDFRDISESSGINQSFNLLPKNEKSETRTPLVGGWTHLKSMILKLDHFPNFRGENIEICETWNHNLVFTCYKQLNHQVLPSQLFSCCGEKLWSCVWCHKGVPSSSPKHSVILILNRKTSWRMVAILF